LLSRALLICGLALLVSTPSRAGQTDLGKAVRDALVAAKVEVAESHRNTVTLVQTPVESHWGKGDFAADPRCNPDRQEEDEVTDIVDLLGPGTPSRWVPDENCDQAFLLRYCEKDEEKLAAGNLRAQGAGARKLCLGHSDALLDQLYDELISAQESIDIASLYPLNGRYLTTLRAALHYLESNDRRITVRVQYAWVTFKKFHGMVEEIVGPRRDGLGINAPLNKGNIKVQMGYVLTGLASWNHAKIVAIDGHKALVTGNNLVEEDYLNQKPVHDLGVLVEGDGALAAHDFVNRLWELTRENYGRTFVPANPRAWHYSFDGRYVNGQSIRSGTKESCPGAKDFAPVAARHGKPRGDTHVIALPRWGKSYSGSSAEPSDVGIAALIKGAQSRIYLAQPRMSEDSSLYNIGGASGGFASAILAELVDALARGIWVRAVFANEKPEVGDKDKGYGGMRPGELISLMRRRMVATWGKDDPKITRALCHLRVATLKYSGDDAYPAALHSKFVIADTSAYYVGSHNLYDANLFEFGYLVDGKEEAKSAEERYWNHLWQYSRETSVRGDSDANCKDVAEPR